MEVGHYYQENIGEDPWSSSKSEQKNPVLKVTMACHEFQETSLDTMDYPHESKRHAY